MRNGSLKLKLLMPLFLLVLILFGCVRYSDGELVEEPKEEETQDETASNETSEEETQAEEDPDEIETAEEKKENNSQAAADVKKRVEEAKEANVKPASEKSVSTETPKVTESTLTPEEEITEIITNELGAKTNMENERIISLTDMNEDGTYFLAVLNGNENFTSSTTKRGLQLDTATILESISQIDGIQKVVIQWYLPLFDVSGNEVDTQVMIVNINREALDEINWDNFDVENFEVVSETYFEHAVLNE